MKKIINFIDKYWTYLLIAVIGVSLVIVSFDMMGINFIKWLIEPDTLVYVAIIISVGIIFLTMYLSKKFRKL